MKSSNGTLGDEVFEAHVEAMFEGALPSYRYLVLPNAIVIPDKPTDTALVYHVLHEWCHAQLSNTVLGLTCQVLRKLAGLLQRRIFPPVGEFLQAHYKQNRISRRMLRSLYVFGRFEPKEQVPESVRDEWVRYALREDVTEWLRGFDRICDRARRIWDSWRLAQEMFAIGWSQGLALGSIEDETDLVSKIEATLEVTTGNLKSELAALARAEAEKLSDGKLLYGRAFQAVRDFSSHPGTPSGVLTAAMVATHFDYPSCDLLDVSDVEFSDLLSSGILNPALRLSRLAGHKDLTARFLEDPSVGSELLSLASGSAPERKALDGDSITYGGWSRRHLWGSSLFERCIGKKMEEFIFGEALELSKKVDHERRRDFRLLEINEPAWVFERDRKASINSASSKAFWQNFRDGYETERSYLLFRSLRSAFGPASH